MSVDDCVRFARDRGAVGIADGDDLGALDAGMPDGHQGVGGLAGLTDGDAQRLRIDDRIAVAELGGHLDLAGHPRPVLDGVFGDHPGVVGGAAGDDHDLVDTAQVFG
ncbi:hypothetical protein SDC9_117161 [bioreactor metagenome]|uniref:Uncharacterized protein n=1 Tax=bioreactor metagenome TaxID=1076179 RepID=A0A645BYL4_9ZZZZ